MDVPFEKKAFYIALRKSRSCSPSTPSTVRDWIHSGHLPAFQLSERIYRVPLGSVMGLLHATQEVTRSTPTAEQAERAYGMRWKPSISSRQPPARDSAAAATV